MLQRDYVRLLTEDSNVTFVKSYPARVNYTVDTEIDDLWLTHRPSTLPGRAFAQLDYRTCQPSFTVTYADRRRKTLVLVRGSWNKSDRTDQDIRACHLHAATLGMDFAFVTEKDIRVPNLADANLCYRYRRLGVHTPTLDQTRSVLGDSAKTCRALSTALCGHPANALARIYALLTNGALERVDGSPLPHPDAVVRVPITALTTARSRQSSTRVTPKEGLE